MKLDEYFIEIEQALKAGNLIGTINLLKHIADKANNNNFALPGKYFFYQGIVEHQLNNTVAALNNFNQALKLNSQCEQTLLYIARLLYMQKNYEEAIVNYKKAIAINSANPLTLFELGTAYFDARKIDEADKWFKVVLKMQPKNKNACLKKGNIFFARNQIADAISHYDKAIEIDPQFVEAWYYKGMALSYLDEFSLAIDAFDEALAIMPKDFDARREKIKCLIFDNKFEEAQMLIKDILESEPKNIFFLSLLGYTHLYFQQFSQAEELFNRILNEVYYDLAMHGLGLLLYNNKQFDRAQTSLLTAESDPFPFSLKELLFLRAAIFWQWQLHQEAKQLYERAVLLSCSTWLSNKINQLNNEISLIQNNTLKSTPLPKKNELASFSSSYNLFALNTDHSEENDLSQMISKINNSIMKKS